MPATFSVTASVYTPSLTVTASVHSRRRPLTIANHALPSPVFMPKNGMRMRGEEAGLPSSRVNSPQRPSSIIHQPGSPRRRTAASFTSVTRTRSSGMSIVRSSNRHAPSGWQTSGTCRVSLFPFLQVRRTDAPARAADSAAPGTARQQNAATARIMAFVFIARSPGYGR